MTASEPHPGRSDRRFAGIGGWIALAALLGLAYAFWGTAEVLPTGDVAPPLSAELSTGGSFDLGHERGRIVVLNFFATWCPPCREEAPELTRVHQRLSAAGGSLVGLVADDGPLARVAASARSLGVGYPVARAHGQAFDRYRVTQLPTTYVISPDGRIVWSRVGRVTEHQLDAAIAAAGARR